MLQRKYDQPVMDAVDFIAGETAMKKRQERAQAHDVAMLDKNRRYDAIFGKAQRNWAVEDRDLGNQRQDVQLKNETLKNLMTDPFSPMQNRQQAGTELFQGQGIENAFERNPMPFTDLALKYFPDLRGKENEIGLENVDLVNQRALQMEQQEAQSNYYNTRAGEYGGRGSSHYTYKVPEALLPYTAGQRFVDEPTYRSVLDDYNKEWTQEPKRKSDELYGQFADIRAENEALNEQLYNLQMDDNGKVSKNKVKKNAKLIADAERKLAENNERMQQLQNIRNQMIFGDDSVVMKNLTPPEEPSAETTAGGFPTNADEARSLYDLGMQYRNRKK